MVHICTNVPQRVKRIYESCFKNYQMKRGWKAKRKNFSYRTITFSSGNVWNKLLWSFLKPFFSPQRILLWTEAFSLAAQVSAEPIACFFFWTNQRLYYSRYFPFLYKITFSRTCLLLTISFGESWPKEF